MLSRFSKPLSNVYVIWICIILVYALNFISVYTKYLLPIPRMKVEANSTISWQRTRTFVTMHSLQGIYVDEFLNTNKSDKTQELSANSGTIFNNITWINRTRLSKSRPRYRLGLKRKNAVTYVSLNSKIRPYTCNNCFETYFKFDSSDICNSNGRHYQVDILILITTSPLHVRHRTVLRSTWLTYTAKNTRKVRYVFLLGYSNDTALSKQIQSEQRKYNDIVVANFTDSYMNLTFKTIAGFKWVQSFCPQAKWVMKTDDDVFVNVESLIDLTGRYPKTLNTSIIGACWTRKPIREEDSKYYVSNSTFPNSTYPKVCSGTAYVTSFNVIKHILSISPNIPFFHLEDVYVGFCLHQLGLSAKRHRAFRSHIIINKFSTCESKSKSVISTHVGNSFKVALIWKLDCSDKKFPVHSKHAEFHHEQKPLVDLNHAKYRIPVEKDPFKYRRSVDKDQFKYRVPMDKNQFKHRVPMDKNQFKHRVPMDKNQFKFGLPVNKVHL